MFYKKKILFKIIIIFISGLITRIMINNIDINNIIEIIILSIGYNILSYIFYIFHLEFFFINDIITKQSNILDKTKSIETLKKNLDTNTHKTLLKKSAYGKDINLIDKCKCKFYWIFLEENKKDFYDYKSFKTVWNTETKLIKEIKNKVSLKLNDEIYKWKIRKKTLEWFFSRRKS